MSSTEVGSGTGSTDRTATTDRRAEESSWVLEIEDLHVTRGSTPVLRGVDLRLAAGRVHVVLGSSGSGKSTLLRSCLGLVPRPVTTRAATLRLHAAGASYDLADGAVLGRVRGEHVGFVGQDPALDLTPLRRVGSLVCEATGRGRAADVPAVLTGCGLPADAEVARRFGFQLSGGMAQRLALGLATARTPALVLADEPSTALDALARAELGRRLVALAADGTAVLLVTHDVALVAEVADDVSVLAQGVVVESGPAATVLAAPQHAETRALVDLREPAPAPDRAGTPGAAAPVLEVAGLTAGWRRDHTVLRDLDLRVGAGEAVGVAGRSGAGKSTLVSCLTGLLEPDAGAVRVDGRLATRRAWRALRRRVQLVPQDPRGSLNPWRPVARQVRDALDVHRVGTRAERDERVDDLLRRVGLAGHADRRPGQLSTGQCQRVAIARALACRPALVVADEPVTALDAVLRAEVLELLAEVVRTERDDRGSSTALLVISHDLHVLEHLCDRVLVLDEGHVVESLPAGSMRRDARHPLTRALLAAHPVGGPVRSRA